MRGRTALAAALVAALCLRCAVRADAALDATIAIQNAPVRIDSCDARRTGSSGGPLDAANFAARYSFTNTARLTAVSVRLKFTVSDARGNFAFIAYATENGRFSPRATIDRSKRGRAAAQGQPGGTVSCAVDRVVFAGGATWPPGPLPRRAAAPSRTAAPSRKATPLARATATGAPDDHLWLLAGTQANPIAHGHPTYCTAGESVQPWNAAACRYARFLWISQHAKASPSAMPPGVASRSLPAAPAASRNQPKPPCDRDVIDGLNAKVSADARAVRTSESEHAELIDRQAFATALHCGASRPDDQRLIDLGAAGNDFAIGSTEGRLGQFEDAATSLGFAADETSVLLADNSAAPQIRDAAKPLLARIRQWQGYVARRSVPQ